MDAMKLAKKQPAKANISKTIEQVIQLKTRGSFKH